MMLDWISDNLVLVLGLAGAAIALAVSLTTTISKRPPVRVVAILIVLGSLVVVAQQLITASLDAQSKRDQAQAQKARDSIISEIRGTVDRTEDLVTDINDRLGNANAELGDLGARLVSTRATLTGTTDVQTRDKSSGAAWHGFADWVSRNGDDPDTQLCMNMELGAVRAYSVDMMIGYLLAGPNTSDRIWRIVEESGWGAIADDPIVDQAMLRWRGVDCVLFYDGRSEDRKLVAYARARDFALELIARRRTGRKQETEAFLNQPGPPSPNSLAQEFPSVKTWVLDTGDVETVVRTMIDNKWAQCVAVEEDGQFLVLLERVIRAAS